MISDILKTFTLRRTPQTEPARADQVRNHAGGYAFALSDVQRLRRFLVLGTDAGTFYQSPLELTRENAEIVVRMAETDHATLLATVVEVSTSGLAPRANPALFALAVAASVGTDDERRAALAALPQVARTGTHLFLFAGYAEQFRGWGRGLRRAVAAWYTDPDVDDVAYQVAKYRQRGGWTHRDLLRLSHPVSTEPARQALFGWVTGGEVTEQVPAVVRRLEAARTATGAELLGLVDQGLTWEMIPTGALADAAVWKTLVLRGMPMTALVRQLGRLTALGVVAPGSPAARTVVAQLADAERVRRARIHPLQALTALTTYSQGRGVRGGLTWEPVQDVVDALDGLFYAAFANVRPTGLRLRLALDVSGSMTWGTIAGSPVTPAVGTAAMALVTAATEAGAGGAVETVAFSTELVPVRISPRMRLDDVVRRLRRVGFGGTDVAAPIVDATRTGREVDAFVVYTDNETWHGNIHPYQALREYRERTGIPAKLVVVGMTSTGFTVADPDDGGMLDVVGFDASAPAVIGDFLRGA
ncbi:TROVE domain-containing protein [Mariniluteicoccus endophyticus]